MIVGIGTDITEVSRIAETLRVYGERFERKVFSPEEVAYCRSSPRRSAERYAARFAAKEALAKALGLGIARGIHWTDIAVAKLPGGKPELRLSGKAARLCEGLRAHLTLTHTDGLAMAFVVLERVS
jgi:holo-[acyl-carrier protein] synthase